MILRWMVWRRGKQQQHVVESERRRRGRCRAERIRQTQRERQRLALAVSPRHADGRRRGRCAIDERRRERSKGVTPRVRHVCVHVVHHGIIKLEAVYSIHQEHRAAREVIARPVDAYHPETLSAIVFMHLRHSGQGTQTLHRGAVPEMDQHPLAFCLQFLHIERLRVQPLHVTAGGKARGVLPDAQLCKEAQIDAEHGQKFGNGCVGRELQCEHAACRGCTGNKQRETSSPRARSPALERHSLPFSPPFPL